jgi:hypothetical protein
VERLRVWQALERLGSACRHRVSAGRLLRVLHGQDDAAEQARSSVSSAPDQNRKDLHREFCRDRTQ